MKVRTTTDTSTVDTNSTDHTLPTTVSVQQAGMDHTCSHYSDASAVFSILPHCHMSTQHVATRKSLVATVGKLAVSVAPTRQGKF